MKIAFKIAFNFLFSTKAQSMLIIIAIGIGISVQLFIGLLIQGLQSDLINSTIGSSSHITITLENDEYLEVGDDVLKGINNNSDFAKVSYVLEANAFMNNDNTVVVNGINYDEKSNIYGLEDKLVEGKLPTNDNEIIIGKYYETINVSDKIILTNSNDLTKEYVVVGKFNFGTKEVNERMVYTTLNSVQSYMGLENKVSKIETQIDNVFASADIKNKLDLPEKYNVVTWEEANEELLSALSSQSLSSYIIQVFVVISVALAISSVLIISVVQKSKQIGIIKAMGLNDTGVSLIFLSQGLIFGVLGSLLGIGLGLGLLKSFSTFALDELGNPVININYNVQFIFISFGIGVVSAIIASLIPAYKSKKLTAMEVIKNG